jgi:hypothetical protein
VVQVAVRATQRSRYGARDEGILLVCSHSNRAKAQKMVECLQRYRVEIRRVVEGVCDECDVRRDRTDESNQAKRDSIGRSDEKGEEA